MLDVETQTVLLAVDRMHETLETRERDTQMVWCTPGWGRL